MLMKEDKYMNRKVALAVGAAAAVAFTGTAIASDLQTINNTEGYVDPSIATPFVPYWVTSCSAAVGGSSDTGCSEHGNDMVNSAATGMFFDNTDIVPGDTDTVEDTWLLVGPSGDNPFTSGLFGKNTSYFAGLGEGWVTLGNAFGTGIAGNTCEDGTCPMGGDSTADLPSNNVTWIDQTVVTYVESFQDTDGNLANGGEGDLSLVQNFRAQFNQTGTDVGNSTTVTDFRLEQMVKMGDPDATSGDIQTYQQAVATNGTVFTEPNGDEMEGRIGNMVAQDVEAFFMSCLNCDNGATSPSHAFTPAFFDVRYQDYMDAWSEVPTIVHGGR